MSDEDYSSDNLFIQNIIEFAPPIEELIADTRLNRRSATPPRTLTMVDGRHAAQQLLDGRSTPQECRIWARFLLSRRDVLLEDGYTGLLFDFLEEWSFPDIIPEVDRGSAARWEMILR